MVATAVVGAGVLGAGASVYSSGQAASAQKSAANQASQTELSMFNTANQNLQPYIQAGDTATSQITNLEGGGPNGTAGALSTLENLPGYQFANTQGLKSFQNGATARGLGLSGAQIKGAENYSTGLANTYYNNLLTGLQNTANTGAGAAGTLTGAATATGSQIGQNTIGAGNAQAASSLASGAGIANAANSIPSGLITSQLLQNVGNQGQTSYLTGPNAQSSNNFTNGFSGGNSVDSLFNSGTDYYGGAYTGGTF